MGKQAAVKAQEQTQPIDTPTSHEMHQASLNHNLIIRPIRFPTAPKNAKDLN
jgi:hypothetical protein